MHDLKPLEDAILTGDAKTAKAATEQALAAGIAPLKLVAGPHDAGDGRSGPALSSANEYFVPELLLAARAMKAALELLRPLLAARGISRWAASPSARSKAICTTSAKTSSARCSKAAVTRSLTWA